MAQQTFACPPQHAAELRSIDWSKLDLQKVFALLSMLRDLFAGGAVTPQAVKAACPGCPDEVCGHCCEAMRLSLESAMHSYECCSAPAYGAKP